MSKNNLELDVEVLEENLENSVKIILAQIRPEWEAHFSDLTISSLSGGISNKLFCCYLKSDGPDTSNTILFRVYGKNTEKFVNRQDEIATMKLMNSIKLGPKFYCTFKNGISYEYLPGSIADPKLVYEPLVFPKIAESVATLHLANFKGIDTENDMNPNEKPFVYIKITELLNLIDEENMPKTNDKYSLKSLKEEFNFLWTRIEQYTKAHKSIILFSHNDLLLGNIIYNQTDKTIKFIDYEYSMMNYQAYDIANHFNEFAGVEHPDYSLFPSEEFQLKWIKCYLESFYSKLNRFFVKQSDTTHEIDDLRGIYSSQRYLYKLNDLIKINFK